MGSLAVSRQSSQAVHRERGPGGPVVEETELESRKAKASRVHRSEVREEREPQKGHR